MASEMTLEQVRDRLRAPALMFDSDRRQLADAIDARLAQPAQAVDVGANTWRIDFADGSRIAVFDEPAAAMFAAVGATITPLYTRALAGEPAGWRDMDSAPKDGTEVLLQVQWRAGIPGKQLVGHYMAGGHCIEDHPPIDAGWYFWNGCMFDEAAKPVAWQHLPASPTPDKEG